MIIIRCNKCGKDLTPKLRAGEGRDCKICPRCGDTFCLECAGQSGFCEECWNEIISS